MNPFVTVIMPVRNEGPFMEKSLSAVLAQDYPAGSTEVIVADGMSTDATREIVETFREKHPNLFLVDNPRRVVPSAMNEALKIAKGEIVVRVDGHTVIAPDYVRKCVETLKRTGADNAGGKMSAEGQNFFGQAVALATSTPFGVGGARFHYSEREEWADTVYLGAWPREVFGRIGVFDEEMVRNQDDEFNYRLKKSGGRILLSPDIRSVYTVRGSLKGLWKQYFDYGFWKVRVLQKHPGQMAPRHFAPPAFAAACLFLPFAAPLRPFWGLMLAAYALFLAAGSLAGIRKSPGHAALLPLVFAVLHLSYGLGFLYGLIIFAPRWFDKKP